LTPTVEPEGIVLDLGSVSLPLAGRELFGSDAPVEVEFGVGKGQFLLEWAAAHPEVALIGVERVLKYMRLAAVRASRRGLSNLRLAHTTAEDLLFRCLAEGSVAAAHIYFPDPWPKKRHLKRRFFRPANVARLADVLAPRGLLRVKTDHEGYAAVIGEVLAGEPRLVPVAVEAAFDGVPASNFEVKYAREARRVHRFACRRA
jgi:tRNA (guanine-N7-)-methyltransferase